MDKRGFTLIEAMIALAVLSGAVAILVTSFNYHLNVAARSSREAVSVVLGLQKIEELKLEGRLSALEGGFGEGFAGYNWELVSEDTELKGVKRLELKVGHEGSFFSLVSFVRE
ncbi:MAG: type II secretion system protein [Thermodesulfobacteriota bacterium]|nr:MAG: type II secretion system protein [Thermodesulfobacteriota bacterium]